MQTEKEQVQGQAPNLIIRGGGPSLLRPMAKRFLANGHGPKWAYIFFIVSLAWSCDETNLQLLLRKKMFKKISVRFLGLSHFTPLKNVFVSLACNVMKQTLSYYALYVSYISKRFCFYNIVHLFEIVGNPTKK